MSANLAVLEISALLRSGATNQAAIKAFQIDLLSEFQKKQFQFIWDVSRDSCLIPNTSNLLNSKLLLLLPGPVPI